MDTITPFDWYRMFVGVEPPLYFLEIVVRVLLIYMFAILVVRYLGKRGRRQMSTFELVLVIALGSATGDTMFYPEVPIFYAWLIILLMVLIDRFLSWMQYRSGAINSFLEGTPRLLLREGRIIEESLQKEQLRRDELLGLLREQEIANTGEVEYAFLEPMGNLALLRRSEAKQTQVESTYPDDYQT